jgi:alkaline phosphatase
MKRHRNLKPVLFVSLLCVFALTCESGSAVNNKDGTKHAPKNIIIMISDGCGFNHVDAASLYQYGEIDIQLYEEFPVNLGMSTYMFSGSYDPEEAWSHFNYVKQGYTDSAASATAISTGVKTHSGAIGVDYDNQPLMHIIELCEEMGKATGVVTSVQLSHATPAGFVAHNASRNNYEQIAKEMIYESAVDVIMGCGHPMYDADGNLKQYPNTYRYVGGKSSWNNLIAGTAGGDADGDGVDDPWVLIETRAEFQALMNGETPKRVFGVPQVYKTLQQEICGNKYAEPYEVELTESVPTLEEMTKTALNILDDDSNGFFLMVEGGAVDWASHANQSGRVIEEEIDFNYSVEAVISWVRDNSNWGETLVIVTGDHETGYLTGPNSGIIEDYHVWNPLENNGPGNLPGMEWHSGSHTNSLIPFYAKGRGFKLFKNAAANEDPVIGQFIDNTDIANVIFALLDD